MDETLLTAAAEISARRGGGSWVPDSATFEEALVAFAEALGQDSVMIERLATEVARLSAELDELKRN